jgi:hypothetical protein
MQTAAGSREPGKILPELSQRTARSKVLLQALPERDLPWALRRRKEKPEN